MTIRWILALGLALLCSACVSKPEKPAQRFQILIQAIQKGDRETVQNSFMPQAFQTLKNDMQNLGEPDWFVRLSKDFLSKKIKYKETTWVKVGEHALVHYNFEGEEQTNSLVMIYHEGRWWIDLPGSQLDSSQEIEAIKFSRPDSKSK